jgi:5-formyltetrahydrofolate cyclo-ligase
MLEKLRGVPPDVAERAGRAVAERVLALPALQQATRVALFASLPGELPTRPLFDSLASAGLARLLPRIRGKALEFAPANDWDALEAGPLGVRQPPPAIVAVALEPADVVIVPGLAFDAAGGRLGRGGGYYDRAFAAATRAPFLLAVAFALQIVERVPCDSRDRRVDAIVTERGVHPATQQGRT